MAVTDARSNLATIKRYAVFIRRNNRGGGPDPNEQFVFKPYDIVQYDWGNGEKYTYIQFHQRGNSMTLDELLYDGVRFYDAPPVWDPQAPTNSGQVRS